MTGFAPCPAFEPRPSAGLRAVSLALYVLAAAAVVVAQVPAFVTPAALAVLGWAGARAFAAPRVVRIERRADGRWCIVHRDGRRIVGALDDDCVVFRCLVVVAVRDGWRRTFVPVPADALPADDFRRLRVWLRWAPAPVC